MVNIEELDKIYESLGPGSNPNDWTAFAVRMYTHWEEMSTKLKDYEQRLKRWNDGNNSMVANMQHEKIKLMEDVMHKFIALRMCLDENDNSSIACYDKWMLAYKALDEFTLSELEKDEGNNSGKQEHN